MNVIIEPRANVQIRIDRGVEGQMGPTGPTGPQGAGLNIKGAVPTVQDLPATGNQPGDAYIVTSNGHLYVWEN